MDCLFRALRLGVITYIVPTVVSAAAWVPLTPVSGVTQCNTTGINDSGMSVGNCAPNSASQNGVPWVATALGVSAPLSIWVSGQPCGVGAISNNSRAMGSCISGTGHPSGMRWDASNPSSAPTALTPLPFSLLLPLLRPADLATEALSINDLGGIAGVSISADGVGTAVYYPDGTSTPQRISDWGDNCTPVDINKPATGGPTVALNCPNSAGTSSGWYSEVNGTSYTLGELPKPAGANYCVVTGVNGAGRFAGTCFFPNSAANVSRSAYWTSKTAAPYVLTLSTGSANSALSLNGSGVVLVKQQTEEGLPHFLLWLASPNPLPSVAAVIPPAGVKWIKALALGENGRVAFNYLDGSQRNKACTWTGSGGSSCLIWTNTVDTHVAEAMSRSGSYVAGAVVQGDQSVIGVTAVLQ